MNSYKVKVIVEGKRTETTVQAVNSGDAKKLAEAMFGSKARAQTAQLLR